MKHLTVAASVVLRGLLLTTAAFLGACAWEQEPNNLTFGDSVRHMIAAQTANPNYGAPGLDGVQGEAAFQAWQKSVAKPEQVQKQVIQVNVGQ